MNKAPLRIGGALFQRISWNMNIDGEPGGEYESSGGTRFRRAGMLFQGLMITRLLSSEASSSSRRYIGYSSVSSA